MIVRGEIIVKKYKIIIGGFIAIILLVAVNVIGNYQKPCDKKVIKPEKSTSVETTSSSISERTVVAKGKNITILKSDLDYYVKLAKLSNDNCDFDIESRELQYLIKRETLFNKAKSKGFLCNKREVSSYIAEQKKLVHNANSYDDFCKYLNNVGFKENDYWTEQSKQVRKDLSISNYLNSIKKKLADENNLKFYPTYVKVASSVVDDSTSDYAKLNKKWDKYYSDLVETSLKEENVILYN